MATPLIQDLNMYQGETFQFTFTYYTDDTKTTPVDLTNWSARMQVRQRVSSANPVTGLNLTSPGDITLGGAAGTVKVTVEATATAALPLNFSKKTWFYDLELEDDSVPAVVTRLAEGKVFAIPEITR